METGYTPKKLNDLARAFKHGDHSAAEKIFNHFYQPIYRYIRSRLSDKDAAADVAQNVFLKVARAIATFDEEKGNLSTWIWHIARNTFTDHLRALKRTMADPETALDAEIDSMLIETENTEYARDTAGQIMKIIEEYSPEDKELFRLRYVADLNYQEISEITGRTENALRVALSRIREKIRKDYDE